MLALRLRDEEDAAVGAADSDPLHGVGLGHLHLVRGLAVGDGDAGLQRAPTRLLLGSRDRGGEIDFRGREPQVPIASA